MRRCLVSVALLLGALLPAPAEAPDNGGFEAEAYAKSPGLAVHNGGITGWECQGNVGVNPLRNGQAPFWDNGTLPEGRRLAFIQGPGWLRCRVPAQAGHRYRVTYRENARVQRQGTQWPRARATLGGQEVVSAHEVTPVAGRDDFSVPFCRVVSAWHTAAADGPLELLLATVQTSPTTTWLVDDVGIEDQQPTP